MKKVAVILLMCLYLIPTLGISASIHYCGGKINNIDFLSSKDHKCCCNGKPMKKDCCKDKNVSIKKTQTAEQTAKIFTAKVQTFFLACILPHYDFVTKQHVSFPTKIVFSNHSPPPDSKHPIYLKDRCFLI